MTTSHLADDVLLDVIEDGSTEAARGHLGGCAECRQRLADAREALALLADADVPEPSPLYWTAFRQQVERRLQSPVSRLLRPAFLVPLLAAAAAVVVALWTPSPPAPPTPGTLVAGAVLPAWSALPAADEDEALMMLGALVPATEEAPVAAACEGAACLMAELSDEESAALADALRRELPAARKL
jgi:hypothetical protein